VESEEYAKNLMLVASRLHRRTIASDSIFFRKMRVERTSSLFEKTLG